MGARFVSMRRSSAPLRRSQIVRLCTSTLTPYVTASAPEADSAAEGSVVSPESSEYCAAYAATRAGASAIPCSIHRGGRATVPSAATSPGDYGRVQDFVRRVSSRPGLPLCDLADEGVREEEKEET